MTTITYPDPIDNRWIDTLSDAELEQLFDLGYHFKNVDTVFARVFGQDAHAKAAAE